MSGNARAGVGEQTSRRSGACGHPLQRLINANGAAPEGLHVSFVAKVDGDWQGVAHPPNTRESYLGELTARSLPRGGKGLPHRPAGAVLGFRLHARLGECLMDVNRADPQVALHLHQRGRSAQVRSFDYGVAHCGTRVARPRSGRSRRIPETRWSVPPLIAVATAAAVVVLGELSPGLLVWWDLLCCLGDVCSLATLCAFKTVRLLPDRCLHTTFKTCADSRRSR